jgi:hypothetical protein
MSTRDKFYYSGVVIYSTGLLCGFLLTINGHVGLGLSTMVASLAVFWCLLDLSRR